MTPAEIRAARKQLGLTQAGFARVMGLGHDYITKIENGSRDMGKTAELLLRVYLAGYRPDDWPA